MTKPGKIAKFIWSPFGFVVGCTIGVVLLFSVFFSIVDGPSYRPDLGPSVEDFRLQFISKMDEDLANPENFIRKKIENAHWTVKSTSARVTACSAYTVDGSDRAGKDYSNISEVDFIVTTFWDGIFQKGGFTEIRMTIDAKSGQVKTCAYAGGNAMFNVDEIDWGKVGEVAAPIVISLITGGG
jgi:hypothetical protein